MHKLFYKSDFNEKIGYFINNLNYEDVVMGNYFFIPSEGNFEQDPLYNSVEVDLISYLTDIEYYFVANKIINPESLMKIKEIIVNKLQNLQKLISDFNQLEKYKNKLNSVNQEIEDLHIKISALEKIFSKNKINIHEIERYKHFYSLNLDKIYSDIININSQINKLEADLLDFKTKEIAYKKIKFTYNKILIGLGLGFFISACFMIIFYLIFNFNFIPIMTIFIILIFASLIFFINSRKRITVHELNDYSHKLDQVQKKILFLKNKKREILKLANLNTDVDFFLAKAKFTAINNAFSTLGYKVTVDNNPLTVMNLNFNKLENLNNEKKLLEFHISNLTFANKKSLTEIQSEIDKLNNQIDLLNKILQFNSDESYSRLIVIKDELLNVFKKYRQNEFVKFVKELTKVNANISELCKSLNMNTFIVSSSFKDRAFSSLERLIYYIAFIKSTININNLTIILNISQFAGVDKLNNLFDLALNDSTCTLIFIK